MINARQFLSLLICSITFLASEAQSLNPAEKHLQAHQEYDVASCPISSSQIRHFVYFSKDRQSLRSHPLLTSSSFHGAQIMYSWDQLEPSRGGYDFSLIREDLALLNQHGKTLFLQLQDATFSPNRIAIPKYLRSPEFDHGMIEQLTDDGEHEGWVAKRWNVEVQARFALLLTALGESFDGIIEGINLQETAIGVSQRQDSTFTAESYVEALKVNMESLKTAFPKSTTLQYANFMPGEWLPWEDFGYLRDLYRHGEQIGVGLGAPDLMFSNKGQLNHAMSMMHENDYTVPLAIAVQDGNYIGKTNSEEVKEERENLVPKLFAFAQDFLRVDYIFWSNQQPYFREDVLPCLTSVETKN